MQSEPCRAHAVGEAGGYSEVHCKLLPRPTLASRPGTLRPVARHRRDARTTATRTCWTRYSTPSWRAALTGNETLYTWSGPRIFFKCMTRGPGCTGTIIFQMYDSRERGHKHNNIFQMYHTRARGHGHNNIFQMYDTRARGHGHNNSFQMYDTRVPGHRCKNIFQMYDMRARGRRHDNICRMYDVPARPGAQAQAYFSNL